MSSHEPSQAAAGIPLQALVAELRSRCEAISRLQGGDPYYREELAIFRQVAGEQNLFLQTPPDELTPATDEEIQCFFTSSGWRRFVIDGNVAYFDPERRVVASDTHRGNIILMDDGLLAPIDLRVQAVSGSLLDTVAKLCASAS